MKTEIQKDQLVLCYTNSNQPNMPPSVLVGKYVDGNEGTTTLKGVFSADITYFSLIGKRLKPLLDREELEKARGDQSMRGLPQLGPSDFAMMGVKDTTGYTESLTILYDHNISYILSLEDESPFSIAYQLMVEALTSDSRLQTFFNESVFDFEMKHYLSSLMDADKVKDILVPQAIKPTEG